jgi:hypothetical protein
MDDFDELKPAEAARDKRRDRDAAARARAGMQTGLAKQFKQVLDSQRRRAEEAERLLSEERDAREAEGERPTRGRGKAGHRRP